MADRNSKIFNEQIKDISTLVKCYRKDRSKMLKLGSMILNQIRKRTRLGFGVLKNGKKVALKALKSVAYKNQRRRSKNLSNLTTAGKSNLTATGLMLKSLTRFVRAGRIFVTIKPTTGKDLSGNSSEVTSQEKANRQAKQGRRFLDLASFEEKKFANFVTKDLKKLSRKKLNN